MLRNSIFSPAKETQDSESKKVPVNSDEKALDPEKVFEYISRNLHPQISLEQAEQTFKHSTTDFILRNEINFMAAAGNRYFFIYYQLNNKTKEGYLAVTPEGQCSVVEDPDANAENKITFSFDVSQETLTMNQPEITPSSFRPGFGSNNT